MNEILPAPTPAGQRTHPSARARLVVLGILVGTARFLSPLSAQTTITILNSGFESPTPTSLPGYTVGATNWTRTRTDINAGTFAPALASPPNPTPAPIDGSQTGYADGSGGLQQITADTFAANQLYTYSVYVGFRSDEANSTQGTGAITLGYIDAGSSTFVPLSTQSATVTRGNFNFVTGSYQTTGPALGQSIALQLTSVGSYQVLFDQTRLSFTVNAIPEPSIGALAIGAAALGAVCWRRRAQRCGSSASTRN